MPHYIITKTGSITQPCRDFEVKFNTRVKYLPGNVLKISCFSSQIFNPNKAEKIKPDEQYEPPEILFDIDPESGEKMYRFVEGKTAYNPFTDTFMPISVMRDPNSPTRMDSIKRAIDKAFEIGLANNFQYFITLTLDEKKIDRYDKHEIYTKLKVWLSNMVSRYGMDYILFPEYHKLEDGKTERAIHFHGLVNAQKLNLIDSGKKTKNGQTIFNLENWKFGFSTVIELDGRQNVVSYVTKYVTKENTKLFGKHYFSGGRTLTRELPREYLNIDYQKFDGTEYKIKAANMSVKYKTLNLDELSKTQGEDIT